jgi:molybdate transport system regulatory protein
VTPAPLDLRARLRAPGGGFVFGPGKAALLRALDDHGSIAAAARSMGMSYRRAWTLVAQMNRDFAPPLVATRHGGAARGGASLTPAGAAALAAWEALDQDLARAAAAHAAGLAARLAPARAA